MEIKNEAIVCIVNRGFTDLVMTAARKAGARGGTVLNAHGTGNHEMEKYFGVIITPEKEMVIIIAPTNIRDQILLAVNESAGMDTKGQGIAFSLPVSGTVGIDEYDEEAKKEGEAEAKAE
ncbi:MAG: P-II family nitrogen regulator [Bacilli bacterium]|nr:P-II family nitrogen regulator [Bacilli bacterium]